MPSTIASPSISDAVGLLPSFRSVAARPDFNRAAPPMARPTARPQAAPIQRRHDRQGRDVVHVLSLDGQVVHAMDAGDTVYGAGGQGPVETAQLLARPEVAGRDPLAPRLAVELVQAGGADSLAAASLPGLQFQRRVGLGRQIITLDAGVTAATFSATESTAVQRGPDGKCSTR